MNKQHHFIVVGEFDGEGGIVWSIDGEGSISPDGPEYSVWNNDSSEWESCSDNMPEDNNMYNELRRILSKDYDLSTAD